jgi:phospholipase C
MIVFKRLYEVSFFGLLLALCGCTGLTNSTSTSPTGSVQNLNHIVVMAQENRSFDSYFGQLPAYWAANGYPSQQFDGLPAGASNPAYTGTTTPGTTNVSAFHVATECIENLSPSWDESHEDWNLQAPASSTPMMNGFVYNAAQFAVDSNAAGANPQYSDTQGLRAMGYYDDSDLNYYYFMASNFATSDRWFAPALDRTQVNRMYLFAATSQGYAYPPGTDAADNAPLTAATIFDELTQAGVSWKIYASDNICSTSPPPDVAERASRGKVEDTSNTGPCTYLTQFAKFAPPNALPSNVVPVSQYLTDVANGTLPSVAFIEAGYLSNRDEHPSTGTNVQTGAAYVESLINALMSSPSWKDSVFMLTYDEPGGLYDHVPPQPTVNPDGIAPIDLLPGDICSTPGGANCDFNYTGYRLPLIVISPFTKKNYVSHTVADYTAILKLIETRFNVPALTQRDAAQMDMTEFFDFQNVPWATPPNPPSQNTGGTCNALSLGYPNP